MNYFRFQWIPEKERSKLGSLALGGSQVCLKILLEMAKLSNFK